MPIRLPRTVGTVAAVMLAVALVAPAVAVAQPQGEGAAGEAGVADIKDARVAYERATAAYALGKFTDAAALFERAFELKGDPELLFNAAQSRRQSGDKQRALDLYSSYLRLYPRARLRDTAAKHAEALRRQIAEEGLATGGAGGATAPGAARPPERPLPLPPPGATAGAGAALPPAPPPSPSAGAGSPPVASAGAVGDPGAGAAAGSAGGAPAAGVDLRLAAAPPEAPGATGGAAEPASPRRTWIWIALGAAVAVAAVGVAIAVSSGTSQPDPSWGSLGGTQ